MRPLRGWLINFCNTMKKLAVLVIDWHTMAALNAAGFMLIIIDNLCDSGVKVIERL